MRETYNSKMLFNDDGSFIGFDLGADYCAEHEWGIKGIHKGLGHMLDIMGIERFMNTKVPSSENLFVAEFQRKGKKYIGMCYDSRGWYGKPEVKHIMAMPYGDEREIFAQWDSNGFAVTVAIKYKNHLQTIIKAIELQDLAVYVGASSNPYGRGGLQLLIASAQDKKFLKEMENKHKDEALLAKADAKAGVKIMLKNAGKRYCSLSPAWYSPSFKPNNRTLRTRYPVIYFLNPSMGDGKCGWYTVEELKAWAKGKKSIVTA